MTIFQHPLNRLLDHQILALVYLALARHLDLEPRHLFTSLLHHVMIRLNHQASRRLLNHQSLHFTYPAWAHLLNLEQHHFVDLLRH